MVRNIHKLYIIATLILVYVKTNKIMEILPTTLVNTKFITSRYAQYIGNRSDTG